MFRGTGPFWCAAGLGPRAPTLGSDWTISIANMNCWPARAPWKIAVGDGLMHNWTNYCRQSGEFYNQIPETVKFRLTGGLVR